MRILPILFYLQKEFGENFLNQAKAFEIIHNVSSLTHGHIRSQIACAIYIAIAHYVTQCGDLEDAIMQGIKKAFSFYEGQENFKNDLIFYFRLKEKNFKNVPESEIKSTTYVLDCLDASIWCLLNTTSYKEAVLKAVNLGDDTDTTGAVTGGIAGLFYGYEHIPQDWLNTIAKRNWIENLCV